MANLVFSPLPPPKKIYRCRYINIYFNIFGPSKKSIIKEIGPFCSFLFGLVLVLPSALVERFSVSSMQDFFYTYYPTRHNYIWHYVSQWKFCIHTERISPYEIILSDIVLWNVLWIPEEARTLTETPTRPKVIFYQMSYNPNPVQWEF